MPEAHQYAADTAQGMPPETFQSRATALIPSARLLAVMAGLLALAVPASVWTSLAPLWLAAAALLLTVAAADGVQLVRQPDPWVTRTVPPALALGVTSEVVLDIGNPSRRRLVLTVHDLHPEATEARDLPRRIEIPPRRSAVVRYPLRPLARGTQRFQAVETRVRSPCGLWEHRRRTGPRTEVRVYPNFREVSKYALFATDQRLSQLGVLQKRRRGEGLEFHQLRDYRQGDALRQIDWKASSRFRKLVSREYQDERNQQIMFLIDCGRRMAAQDGPLTHFDHTLNAMLLLAYVGLRQGDAVGLMTMGADPLDERRYLPARKSLSALNLILNTVFDLQPTLISSDFVAAAAALVQQVNKRALVIVLTNIRDEDCADLLPALNLLRNRHLVLVASLRERAIRDLLLRPVHQFADALGQAAAADYLHARRTAFARLTGAGALCLDVEPEQLPLQLVNRYLDVKRSGLL